MSPDPRRPRRFDRFELDDVLGVGGMGVVHVATDTRLGRRVALKLMSGPLAADPAFRERFLREARVLTRLDSPHVIRVYDHGDQDGTLWIATQYVVGGDVGAQLRRRGPMPPVLALEICRQVADALAAAHAAGIVHRDIKPANVLLRDPDAVRPEAYLCDFGIASTGVAGLTATGAVAGTFEYLAPEYGQGAPAGPAGDVYALGCLLWACLVGRPPYTGSAIDVARGHRDGPVPRLAGRSAWVGRLNDVLARCLAKDPARRHTTAAALRDDLADLVRTAPTPGSAQAEPLAPLPSAGPQSAGQPSRPDRRPRRVAVGIAAVTALAVVGGLVAWAITSDDEAAPRDDATGGPGPPPASEATPAVTGDVTGDGRGDLVVRDWDRPPERTAVLASDGTAFGDPTSLLDGVYEVVSGDVDGDGAEELVSIEAGSDAVTVTVTSVGAAGEETGSETYEVPLADALVDLATPTLGDLDGDGYDDLLVSSFYGSTGDRLQIAVALSTGDGFAGFVPVFDEEGDYDTVASADVDDDGIDEVVVLTDDSAEVLEPDAEVTALTGGGPTTLTGFLLNPAVGDFDGDGRHEVAFATGSGETQALALLRWDGTSWDDEIWWSEDGSGADLDLAASNPAAGVVDVDGDGTDDLVRFARPDSGPPDTVSVFLGSDSGFEASRAWAEYTCECKDFYDPALAYLPR